VAVVVWDNITGHGVQDVVEVAVTIVAQAATAKRAVIARFPWDLMEH
jgi:hypothetical protein